MIIKIGFKANYKLDKIGFMPHNKNMRYETETRPGTRIETRNIEETIRKAYADVSRSHRRQMSKLERAREFVANTTDAIELPEISANGMLIEDGFHRMRALLEMGIEEMPMRIMFA